MTVAGISMKINTGSSNINFLILLTNAAIILVLCTILLGSYTRLTEAGLGCPDWPGCYGFMSAPKQTQLDEVQKKFPNVKVEPKKAHNEMSHRYIAGLLGVSVVFIFLISQWRKSHRLLTACILVLVLLQAALGMWTVTLQLLPLVVLAHLLGGFSLLSLLVLLRLKIQHKISIAIEAQPEPGLARLLPFAFVVLFVLVLQISLGAWTSSNYAALACHQLPICEPGWEHRFNFSSAFSLPMGQSNYQYGVMSYDARLSIHVLHRIGAFITFMLLGSLSYMAVRGATSTTMQRLGIALGGLLMLQCCLGVINVVAYLPLLNAVAHNFVAANLLMLLVVFIYQLYRRRDYSKSLQKINQSLTAHTNSITVKV